MTLDLRHFRLLRAVNEHGTITGAARDLGYSQPALTQQIQSLERRIGMPVLVRNRRGVKLSEAGRVLLRHGDQVLRLVALAEREVEAVAGLRSGRLKIAVFPSAAGALLPEMFSRLKRNHPGLSFEMVEAGPARATELLRRGDCDLAVVYWHWTADETHGAPELGDGEVLTPLFDERVDVALPSSHPLAEQSSIEIQDLHQDLWIAGCPLCRGNLELLCELAGFSPSIGFETDDYLALHRLVALGLGVALVPELMHTVLPEDERLVFRRLRPPSFRRVGAISTEALADTPAVRRALEALLELVPTLGLGVQADGVQ